MRLQLEDGPPPQLNAIKEDATVKVVFTPTFSITPLKNARSSVLELVRVLGKPDVEIQQILQ